MVTGFIFLGIVGSFLLGICVGNYLRRNRERCFSLNNAGAGRIRERQRIVNHRDKRTLIVPENKPATDETQVLYFANGKGFVNGNQI